MIHRSISTIAKCNWRYRADILPQHIYFTWRVGLGVWTGRHPKRMHPSYKTSAMTRWELNGTKPTGLQAFIVMFMACLQGVTLLRFLSSCTKLKIGRRLTMLAWRIIVCYTIGFAMERIQKIKWQKNTEDKMKLHQMAVNAVVVILQYDMKYHPLFEVN